MTYTWNACSVDDEKLVQTLTHLESTGWEIFQVIPLGATVVSSGTLQKMFPKYKIIVRKRL